MNNNDKKLDNNLNGYKYLFHLENLLREWLDKKLKNKYGKNYFNKNVFNIKKMKNGQHNTIDLYEIAEKRKSDDIRDKVVGADKLPLIYFLDLWHLGKIIELKWDNFFEHDFSNYFTKFEIKSRFNMLNGPRNLIAHSHSIREVQVGFLKETLDFFSRNISNKSIEQLENIYLENFDNGSNDVEFVHEIYTALINSDELPKDFEVYISKMKVNRLYDSSIKDLIKNIEKLLLKYNKKRKLIGGFEKAKIFTKSSKILVKLKQLIEKVT